MSEGIKILIIGIMLVIISLLPYVLNVFFSKEVKEKHKLTTKQLMYVVNLTALATVIGFIEIPLGTIIPGGKFDFSEVIILISLLVLGFKNTMFVIFFRSFIRFFLIPNELDFIMKLLGEVIAMLVSLIITTSFISICKMLKVNKKPLMYAVDIEVNKPSYKEFILIPTITTLVLVVILFFFHYFITIPIYSSLLGLEFVGIEAKVLVIIPFTILNVLKGVLSPTIFLLIKNQIQKVVK